jgi:hypothetical protein
VKPTTDETLSEAVDELAIAVDRLFVTELRRGIADEETVDLIAMALDLAAVTRRSVSDGETRCANGKPDASTDDAEVTCSG